MWETNKNAPSFIVLLYVSVKERWANTDFLGIYGKHLLNIWLSQDIRYHLEKHTVVWFFHLVRLYSGPYLTMTNCVAPQDTHAAIIFRHLCNFNMIKISVYYLLEWFFVVVWVWVFFCFVLLVFFTNTELLGEPDISYSWQHISSSSKKI